MRLLRRYGIAVVPNGELADRCRRSGVTAFVAHGYLEPFEANEFADSQVQDIGRDGRPVVLVPLAYAFDEPVEEILAAARLAPEMHFVLTGKAPAKFKRDAPTNVTFAGFVSKVEYNQLRSIADVVFAITTQEGAMQSAGYEALAASTPLVTMPTRVLRDFFDDAAVYAQPTAKSLAEAAHEAATNSKLWSEKMLALRGKRIVEQSDAFAAILSWIART